MISEFSDELECERMEDGENKISPCWLLIGSITLYMIVFIAGCWIVDCISGLGILEFLYRCFHLESIPINENTVTAAVGIIAATGLLIWYVRCPFQFPYLEYRKDVSGKRNVNMEDVIDEFLIQDGVWDEIKEQERHVQEWIENSKKKAMRSIVFPHRIKQLDKSIDENAYRFKTMRTQTRYRQQNYVKYPYKVGVIDKEKPMSFAELEGRHTKLNEIGNETTLRRYRSKNQRKLMTPSLRRKIAERDGYRCQCCGKYMPDGVGLQIDHIVPVSKGGKTVPSNLQVLCSRCNGQKGSSS